MSNPIFMTPQYNTMKFTDVWDSVESFKTDFATSPFNGCISATEGTPTESNPIVPHDSVSRVFYLLYAKYGNNHIANFDVNQFKFKVYSTIFMYGPTWEKRLEIQEKLRALKDEDLVKGSKAIYNTAMNPSSAPSSGSLEELQFINSQNTTNYKKSKMEGFGVLWDLLDTDVTNDFINRFKVCFFAFASPQHPLLYATDVDPQEEEEGE